MKNNKLIEQEFWKSLHVPECCHSRYEGFNMIGKEDVALQLSKHLTEKWKVQRSSKIIERPGVHELYMTWGNREII